MTPEETIQFTLNKFGFEEVTKMDMDHEMLAKGINRLEDRIAKLEHANRSDGPSKRLGMRHLLWSSFETSLLEDDIDKLIEKRAREFGRSTNAVTWKMWHLLSGKRVLPQEP